MQLTVNIGDISEALAQVKMTKDKMLNTPLGYVYMKAHRKDQGKGFLYLYSTNFTTETLVKIPADVKQEGEVAFNPDQVLGGLVGRAKEDNIEMSLAQGGSRERLLIKYKKSRFHVEVPLGTSSLADRVKRLPLADKGKASITGLELGDMCRRAAFCIPSRDSTQPGSVLGGMYVTDDDKGYAAFASDGNIATRIRVSSGKGKLGKFMIPAASMPAMERLLGSRKEENIELIPNKTDGTDPTILYFKAGDIIFGTGLYHGNLENLKQVIQGKQPKFRFQISRDELKSAIDRASNFTDGKSRTLKVEVKTDALEIKMGNTFGENDDRVDIEHRGEFKEAVKLGVNMDYLANIAAGSKSDKLDVGISGPLDAIIVTDEAGPVESRYVLMPVRI